jgi:TetR/AcrR family transcriptional regulator, regulator of biofilm formation and stress response
LPSQPLPSAGPTRSAPSGPRTTQKGQRRREAILAATLQVIAERGISGVTHRAVATAAAVPLAATTYYFASKDDLLEQALEQVATTEIDRLERRIAETRVEPFTREGLVDAFSIDALEMATPRRQMIVAIYELFLAAARRPRLRQIARRWNEAYVRLAEETLRNTGSRDPGRDAQLLIAVVDGLFVQQLAAPQPDFAGQVIAPLLSRLADLVVPEEGDAQP